MSARSYRQQIRDSCGTGPSGSERESTRVTGVAQTPGALTHPAASGSAETVDSQKTAGPGARARADRDRPGAGGESGLLASADDRPMYCSSSPDGSRADTRRTLTGDEHAVVRAEPRSRRGGSEARARSSRCRRRRCPRTHSVPALRSGRWGRAGCLELLLGATGDIQACGLGAIDAGDEARAYTPSARRRLSARSRIGEGMPRTRPPCPRPVVVHEFGHLRAANARSWGRLVSRESRPPDSP